MTAIQDNNEQEIYSNFINSINSEATRLNYELHVDQFKRFCNLSNLSELLAIHEPRIIDEKMAGGIRKKESMLFTAMMTADMLTER